MLILSLTLSVCVCVCNSGVWLLHNSSLPITARRSLVINSTPPFNYSARLPRRGSWGEHVIRPPAAAASPLCHAFINPVAEPENGGEGWKRGRSRSRELGRGDLQRPGDCVSGLPPLSAPPVASQDPITAS